MAILKIKDKNGRVIDIPAIKGKDGVGITNIVFDNFIHYKDYTLNQYIVSYSDGTTSTIDIHAKDGVGEKGKDGVDGIGIYEINLVKTEGLTKTYEIIYGNTEESFEFTITDGYTPVVGKDYFTTDDKNKFYDELQDMLLEGQGGSIQSIEKTASTITADTYTITLTNGNTSTFTVRHGVGISNIVKTNTNKLVDTYTITFDNLETFRFTVTNGKDGQDGRGYIGFEYQETIEEDGVKKDVYYVYDTNDDYEEMYIPHGSDYILTENDKVKIAEIVKSEYFAEIEGLIDESGVVDYDTSF